jgi:hypothetical protein
MYIGVACFQQIELSSLNITTTDMKRSKIQKSVVILARQPFFGAVIIFLFIYLIIIILLIINIIIIILFFYYKVHTRLLPVTKFFFQQKDFTQTYVLEELYNSFSKIT